MSGRGKGGKEEMSGRGKGTKHRRNVWTRKRKTADRQGGDAAQWLPDAEAREE